MRPWASVVGAVLVCAACDPLQQGVPGTDGAVDVPADVAAPDGGDTGVPRECTWADESGSGRTGTLVDFAHTPGAGFAGTGTPDDPTALVFDGVDDRVDPQGDPMHFTAEITFAAWVRLRSNVGIQAVFSNRSTLDAADGYTGLVLYAENGMWKSIYFTGYFTASIDWEHHQGARARIDAWTHLATTLSLSDGFARFYVDGALISERRATRPIRYNAPARPHLGGESATDFLHGSIGLVRVWSRGLSRDEVADEFRATAPRFGVTAEAPAGTVPAADALRYEAPCAR